MSKTTKTILSTITAIGLLSLALTNVHLIIAMLCLLSGIASVLITDFINGIVERKKHGFCSGSKVATIGGSKAYDGFGKIVKVCSEGQFIMKIKKPKRSKKKKSKYISELVDKINKKKEKLWLSGKI